MTTVQDAMAEAVAHHQAGRLDLAETLYRRVLDAAPDHADALNLSGVLRLQRGDGAGAIAAIAHAVAVAPEIAAYRLGLGNALKAVGRMAEAADSFLAAMAAAPTAIEPRFNLANTLQAMNRHDEAARAYAGAIALDPALDGAYNNLGATRRAAARPVEAATLFRQALGLNPHSSGAANNLGNALLACGLVEEALTAYRRAIQAEPRNELLQRNFILALNLSERAGPADILAAGGDWHARFTGPRPSVSYANDREPDRRLRVGYLCGTMFRAHTLANVMMPLIEGHDAAEVDVTIYSDLALDREDAICARFARAARWRRAGTLSNQALAARIRDDGIDVLVDAIGYVEGSRMEALTIHPAPVQVTIPLLGTCGGHGLDYVIADEHLLPPVLEPFFAERVERVPFAYRFDPLGPTPELKPPPVLTRGHITFGSMNSLNKIGPAVIGTWSRLLATFSNSRLLIKAFSLADPELRALLLGRFAEHGIAADRVELRGWAIDQAHHLAAYNDIDIALDSFPYAGVTTTCEALWMGVPVVTLVGDRVLGRYGLSLLRAVGFADGIAEDEQTYVLRAAALAGNTDRLIELRRTLRSTLAGSPLCDKHGAAHAIEQAFRRMWRRWCGL
jgi:predicted O-linked N-acetylglucosamine transferase (SPINDLY family)